MPTIHRSWHSHLYHNKVFTILSRLIYILSGIRILMTRYIFFISQFSTSKKNLYNLHWFYYLCLSSFKRECRYSWHTGGNPSVNWLMVIRAGDIFLDERTVCAEEWCCFTPCSYTLGFIGAVWRRPIKRVKAEGHCTQLELHGANHSVTLIMIYCTEILYSHYIFFLFLISYLCLQTN